MNGATLLDLPPSLRAAVLFGTMFVIGGPSCLVASDPSLEKPSPTAPYLKANDVNHPLDRVLRVKDQPVTFMASLRSEDNGQSLTAALVADSTPNDALVSATFPPNAAGGEERPISLTWDPKSGSEAGAPPLEPGCHTITLVVTHGLARYRNIPVFDFGRDANGNYIVSPAEDVAFLVWWVLVDDPKDPTFADSVPLRSCP